MNGEIPKDAEASVPAEPEVATAAVDPSGQGDQALSSDHGDTIQDMDEALLAAELDAEFDEIRAEIDRINMQEKVGGPTKRLLLQQYRKARKATRKEDADRPPWRVRLDEAIESTIDKFVEDGLEEKADGSIALVFKSELIGTHGVPLLTALLDAMREGLKDNAGKGGAMGAIGPHIIQFIENFRTSFAGAPPEDVAAKAAAGDAGAESKGPKLPPLSIEDVFKGFSGLMASARASAPKPKGKAQPGKKGAKTQTTTFTMKTPDAGPTTSQPSGPGATPGDAKSDGPTINIDFAGLFGSLLKGMTSGKPGPAPKGPPPTETAPTAPASTPEPDPQDPEDP